METSIKGQLTFEQTAEMLTNMDGTLSSESSMSWDLE
jgi:adhesin HecA-like repeat protein